MYYAIFVAINIKGKQQCPVLLNFSNFSPFIKNKNYYKHGYAEGIKSMIDLASNQSAFNNRNTRTRCEI